jgi:hypothetical protein
VQATEARGEANVTASVDRAQEAVPAPPRRLFFGVALIVLAVYGFASRGITTIADEQKVLQTTEALVHGHSEIHPIFPLLTVRRSDGQLVGAYGLGTSAVAAPLYVAARAIALVAPESKQAAIVEATTVFTNSLLTAWAVLVLMFVCALLRAPPAGSVLIGLSYGLGSYAFPHALTLFTEPGTALCVIAAVFYALRASRSGRQRDLIACGACAGVALLFRVSAALFLPIFGIWLLVVSARSKQFRSVVRAGWWYTIGALGPLVLLLLSNWWRYHDPLNFGYQISAATGQSYPILRGLKGQLFSSGKSIFLYAPIAIVVVLGIVRSFRRFPYEMALLAAIVAANLLFFARVQFWSGDWAWGPRYVQIVLPCIAAMAAPLMDLRIWRRVLALFTVLGFAFSALPAVLVRFALIFPAALAAFKGPVFRQQDWDHSHYALMWHTLHWQPILWQLRLLPHTVANTFGFGDPAKPLHSNFQPERARFEFWWLRPSTIGWTTWVLYAFVIAAIAYAGFRLVRSSLRAQPAA